MLYMKTRCKNIPPYSFSSRSQNEEFAWTNVVTFVHKKILLQNFLYNFCRSIPRIIPSTLFNIISDISRSRRIRAHAFETFSNPWQRNSVTYFQTVEPASNLCGSFSIGTSTRPFDPADDQEEDHNYFRRVAGRERIKADVRNSVHAPWSLKRLQNGCRCTIYARTSPLSPLIPRFLLHIAQIYFYIHLVNRILKLRDWKLCVFVIVKI